MIAQVTKVKGFLLYLVGFMLACDIYLTPVLIVVYTLFWIIEGGFKTKLTAIKSNKFVWIFSGFYLLHLMGMLYTKNAAGGWFDLEVKLSLLIFPLMLAPEGPMDMMKQKMFFYSFTTGLILNGLICLGYATWRYFALHVFIFQYMQFSIFLHPSYYSMYIDLALVWIFQLLTLKYTELQKGEKIFMLIAVLFLEFMLVLLQSKTGLFVSAIVMIISFARYIVIKKRWITGLGILAVTIILGGVSYYYIITSGRSRILFAENILKRQKWDSTSTESTQVRHFVWKAAGEVIEQSPIIGVGTGYSRDALQQQYAKDSYIGAYREKLNAHNEYLQAFVTLGVIGLIGLFACLLVPLYKSVKERRFVYMMFLIILVINFLTESMLETQGGTIFYGFLNSLLMFNFVI